MKYIIDLPDSWVIDGRLAIPIITDDEISYAETDFNLVTIEEWEQKREFKVGDVVRTPHATAIITRINHSQNRIYIMFADGSGGWRDKHWLDDVDKTGTSYPEIVEILEKMRAIVQSMNAVVLPEELRSEESEETE